MDRKTIGRADNGRAITARKYITQACAEKWQREGLAEITGTTRDHDGRVFVAVTVFASADRPGYVTHYRARELDGTSDGSAWATSAARALGSIRSERKAAASRANGLKGGRPHHLRGGRPRAHD